MGYGKSKESADQERSNLLGINPIANRASGGSFMSKHSIHSQGGGSPLHQSEEKDPLALVNGELPGREGDDAKVNMKNIKSFAQNLKGLDSLKQVSNFESNTKNRSSLSGELINDFKYKEPTLDGTTSFSSTSGTTNKPGMKFNEYMAKKTKKGDTKENQTETLKGISQMFNIGKNTL